MPNPVRGPTFAEMREPRRLPASLRRLALVAGARTPDEPVNLFNISWKLADGAVNGFVVPPSLTGVAANVLVLSGQHFPTGNAAAGVAYSILREHQLAGRIAPDQDALAFAASAELGATGAWVAERMGYAAGGCSSKIINDSEELGGYRFHAAVTAPAAAELAQGCGAGKVDLFVTTVGSGATLGAGDVLKAEQGTVVAGVESSAGREVAWIHHGEGLDLQVAIDAPAVRQGLALVQLAPEAWTAAVDADPVEGRALVGRFGAVGLANLLGALRAARFLGLGEGRNVVLLAPTGFEATALTPPDGDAVRSAVEVFRAPGRDAITEVTAAMCDHWQRAKSLSWVVQRGKSPEALDAMANQAFWAAERAMAEAFDQLALAARGPADHRHG